MANDKLQPIYTGASGQRLYHFGNNRGASVVHDTRPEHDGHYEVAAITYNDVNAGPQGGFRLDYNRLWPKRGLDEDAVQQLLTQLSSMEPDTQ